MLRLRHLLHNRPHLVCAIVLGLLLGVLTPGHWHPVTRVLLGWNCTVWLYLIFAAWMMGRSDHEQIYRIATREDESAMMVLVIMTLVALASVAAIVIELAAIKQMPLGLRLSRYGLTAATIIGSWALVATLFTFHYAHAYFRSPSEQRALNFPAHESELNYWDFLYFSFTIAVAAQTSDVSVATRALRKAVLAQSVLSFWFNVAIVGLSINIAASLIGA